MEVYILYHISLISASFTWAATHSNEEEFLNAFSGMIAHSEIVLQQQFPLTAAKLKINS